jgi:hypothetical protein
LRNLHTALVIGIAGRQETSSAATAIFLVCAQAGEVGVIELRSIDFEQSVTRKMKH